MGIFFSQKHTNTVDETLTNLHAKLKAITDRRWHDFSEKITGKIKDDNSFEVTQKWSFTHIRWIENSPAYLFGALSSDSDRTIVKLTVRPNSGFVIFFYLLLVLFFCEIFGISTFIDGPRSFKLVFFPFFNLILFGLMKYFTTELRKRFERMLNLRRHE